MSAGVVVGTPKGWVEESQPHGCCAQGKLGAWRGDLLVHFLYGSFLYLTGWQPCPRQELERVDILKAPSNPSHCVIL